MSGPAITGGDADDPSTLRERARARYEAGDLAGAIADLTRVLELEPDDSWAAAARADVRRRADDLAGAIADLDHALALNPENVWALGLRGEIRSDGGDIPGAIADFDHALAVEPANPYALWCRADIRSTVGDYWGATADLTRLMELEPDSKWTWGMRAHVRLEERAYRWVARSRACDLDDILADIAVGAKVEDKEQRCLELFVRSIPLFMRWRDADARAAHAALVDLQLDAARALVQEAEPGSDERSERESSVKGLREQRRELGSDPEFEGRVRAMKDRITRT